jgi:hypothetical protein
MSKSKTDFDKQIARSHLFVELGFPGQKMPTDHERLYHGLILRGRRDQVVIGDASVRVIKSRGRGRHRIHVHCQTCGKWVPFGRYHTHKCCRK